MAFAYVEAGGGRHGAATVVSNNHFDQDGLVGVFALSFPEEAEARRDLLVEVARAGDFAVTGVAPGGPGVHGDRRLRRSRTEPTGRLA